MAKRRLKRTADGSVDLRTKEGKAIAERMAKARAAKNKSKRKIKATSTDPYKKLQKDLTRAFDAWFRSLR
ncbi:MAG: hypothetical protein MJZ33_05880 [Paludibacteraceae bacterium]|nr:hypothetical protein [Paludibacteraceae bacterium]